MLGYKARYWECDKIFVPRRCRTIITYFTFRVDRTIKLLHLGPEVEFIKRQLVEKLKISAYSIQKRVFPIPAIEFTSRVWTLEFFHNRVYNNASAGTNGGLGSLHSFLIRPIAEALGCT